MLSPALSYCIPSDAHDRTCSLQGAETTLHATAVSLLRQRDKNYALTLNKRHASTNSMLINLLDPA
jgi:hypothetical protein